MHLAGDLMGYFFGGISKLSFLTQKFLQRNGGLRHMLKEEHMIITCWRRSAIKEVNDFDHDDGT